MSETINRYSQLNLVGPWWRRILKKFYLYFVAKPSGWVLGEGTYVFSPYSCNVPSKLKLGDRCTVRSGFNVQFLTSWFEQKFDPKISIGDDVYVGLNCELVAASGIKIEDGCTLSDNVYINDSSHGFNPTMGLLMDRPLTVKGQIFIGEGSFIGRGSTILSGVVLGEYCVIGASAVVTKSAPAYSMLAGNPAQIIAKFDREMNSWVKC